MNTFSDQSLNVTNSSQTTNIYVGFLPPENANIPSPPSSPISPGESERIAVKDGTMNMFVWTDTNSPPIWKGIIPTKVKKPVIVSPESNIVLYDGIQIPEGFGPITDLVSGQPSTSSDATKWWTYFIVAFLIVLILVGILWYRGKLRW